MLNQFDYTDTYDCEKLRLLQSMNDQIEIMAIKFNKIISHVEEVHFKIPQNNRPPMIQGPVYTTIKADNRPITNTDNNLLITMNDQPVQNMKQKKTVGPKKSKNSNISTIKTEQLPTGPKVKPPDTTAKRNKQQRQFNTFVRDSINQLLGSDFMRTHDVQDIDSQVMEMIRKEAVENYLPDNIRPRRAWHLAKASLRTLKRTLNNRK